MKGINWVIVGFIFFFCFFSQPATSKINFKDSTQDRIDLEKIDFEKEQFFAFVKNSIEQKPFGLGAYGRVSIKTCDMPYKGRKLIDYKTMKGIGHEYLSNPSCSQTVLRKILQKSYGFQTGKLTEYQNRKCFLNLEKVFSPMLEYYTIRYEERTKSDCRRCEYNEQRRLQKIIDSQQEIGAACQGEKTAVLEFLSDLDEQIESAFQKKSKSATQ